MSKLKECPWCESTEIYFEQDGLGHCYMVCSDCWAQSPHVKDGRGGYMRALGAWNKAPRRNDAE